MTLLPLILLALIQGVTEFLPVSSSGHLVLFHHLYDGGVSEARWADDLMLDVAVHVGTLLAVLVYFWRDILNMLLLRDRVMIAYLILASLPVIGAGYLLYVTQPELLRSLEVMAWMTLIFGIVLYLADRRPEQYELAKIGWQHALLIGLAQVLALIPGTSRSGITMTAARALGYTRTAAARFALLLSIPALAGAGVLAGKDVIESGDAALTEAVILAAIFAFISALIVIAALMKYLQHFSFTPFAIYRVGLGICLLVFIYAGNL